MANKELNKFTQELRDFCKCHNFEEKWLIAPTRRVGFQWLDLVTRAGQPILNVRVKTLQSMALELAMPEMDRSGLTYLRGFKAQVIIGRIFEWLKKSGSGYLSGLELSYELIKTILSVIYDLRLSGLTPEKLMRNVFEVETKGREIIMILTEYEKKLQSQNLVDYADVLRLARKRIRNDSSALSEEVIVLMPNDMVKDLRGLEREFWHSIIQKKRQLLEVDEPEEIYADEPTDAALLQWHSNPIYAPLPEGDGTAKIFRAIGEVNEIRGVLRQCMENKISFDEVEILHTDAAMYVPLLFEFASYLKQDNEESIPVTFAEGIPTRYSRPAKALSGWLSWMQNDYPQSIILRMIQDGLLQIETAEDEGFSFARLGAVFRMVQIGNGRDRYLKAIDMKIAGLEEQTVKKHLSDDESINPAHKPRQVQIESLKLIHTVIEDLFALQPESQSNQKDFLNKVSVFLEKHARCVSQFDEYSRGRLIKEIQDLCACLDDGDFSGLNIDEWLSDLPEIVHVAGQGPRPGCLYVAPLYGGGHSGRKHTFIIGLDDSRFPGSGLQDPLLLDDERNKISDDLPTAAKRLTKNIENFTRLLARLRGEITLSYCCHNLTDDREMFPSPVLLSAYRILSGNLEGNQDDFIKWLPHPVSFAPNTAERCIDHAEWWLWRICSQGPVKNPEGVIALNFPHLGQGFQARLARESDRFTEYDGYVPQAGKDFDPTKPDGMILSANKLEKLGSCPMEFFLKYVLDIEPPEEYRIDPDIWLDALKKGKLLHTVFREFMSRLHKKNLRPNFKRDRDLLKEILRQEIAVCKVENPPPSLDVWEWEVRELEQTASIFLQEEERFCKNSHPLFFEVAIGLPSEGEGTILDIADPIKIPLPGGTFVHVRGRIDRVDEVPGSDRKNFTIWDYKSGGSGKYKQDDPFRQGRFIQNSLYLALAEARLIKKVSTHAAVTRFGYFFPNIREHGKRIEWDFINLEKGKHVLERLCRMIALGCFPFTDDLNDVKYSDYISAFGKMDITAKTVVQKLENEENQTLEPYRMLREYKHDDEE